MPNCPTGYRLLSAPILLGGVGDTREACEVVKDSGRVGPLVSARRGTGGKRLGRSLRLWSGRRRVTIFSQQGLSYMV